MRSEILLTQCEIWLRHVKSALRRASVRDCEDEGTLCVPVFLPKVYKIHQKAPPLAGELSVSDSEQTEGEQLTALGSFEPFPFRHGLRRDTFPVNGDSF